MNKIYQRKSGVMAADMNGETVMMDIQTAAYYNIGSVGGDIWKFMEKPLSKAELVNCLIAEYDVSAEQCAEDIQPFLDEMVSTGLLICKD